VRLGRRVAICDQVEDASEAKGIVRREVTETVTPGTVLADNLLAERRNTFVVCVTREPGGAFALAALDVSTGELTVRAVPAGELRAELGRAEPSELLMPRALEHDPELAPEAARVPRTVRDDWMFEEDVSAEALRQAYGVQSVDGFGFQSGDGALVRATGSLIQYLREIRPSGITHLRPIRIQRPGAVMLLDEMTRRNLELIEPLRTGEEGGTLLDVLDETVTSMGGRLLRRWVLEPLVVAEEIWARQEAVRDLVERPEARERLRHALAGVNDLERLAGKLGTGRVGPRDLAALRRSLERLPAVRGAVAEAEAARVREVADGLDVLEDVRTLLAAAVADDPPGTLHEGGVIRSGWSDVLDELR